MKKRIIGIDLIRIVAMFMIMNYHILLYGSWLVSKRTSTFSHNFSVVAVAITIISVNLFAIISGYVGLNSHHRLSRLIDIHLQVVFYSIVVLAYFLIFKRSYLDSKLILSSIFPTVFKGYWYWNAYLLLFILMPFINNGMKSLSKKGATLLVGLLFFTSSICNCFPNFDIFGVGLGYNFVWLIILYIYGAYFKRYGFGVLAKNKLVTFILFIINWMLIVECSHLFHKYNIGINNNGFDITQFQYTFPLVVTLSILMFILLISINFKNVIFNNVIIFLGNHSFSAYLLQTNFIIFSLVITDKYNFLRYLAPNKMMLCLFGLSMGWYVLAICIDCLRSLLWKILRVKAISNYIERKSMKFFEDLN